MTRSYVYHDFEFTDDNLVLGCFWRLPEGTKVAIDLRAEAGLEQLRQLARDWSDAIWVAYSARAELTCLLRAGVDLAPLDYIDLMVEARQITISHRHFHSPNGGLLSTLQTFGINALGTVAWKETMRHTILTGAPYSDETYREIVKYGWSDVLLLPELHRAILSVYADRKCPYYGKAAMFRAEALKALAILEHRSRGFPVDVPVLHHIFTQRKAVRRAIVERTNQLYSGTVYRYNAQRDDYSFSFKGLQAHLDSLPITVHWPVTPKGRLSTADEKLEQFCARNPAFTPLRDTLSNLRQLNSVDLRELERDGFVKGESLPYHTLTSRSQPLVRQGFLFNAAPWMRLLVKPPPGHVIIGADFSQEEVVIAAAFSGDRRMAEALQGDFYLNLAKMAKAIPPDATKQSHPVQRALYKSASLGIAYAMGANALTGKIYMDLLQGGHPISLDEATERAVEILAWHKATFHVFWRWIKREIAIAKAQGWLRGRDGFTYFCDDMTPATRLQNWPMQAAGAAILREALKHLAKAPVELICTLHDALYLLAPEDELDLAKNTLLRAMTAATHTVMAGTPLPLPIKIDVKQYSHATGYQDDRGTEMYRYILQSLEKPVANPDPLQ